MKQETQADHEPCKPTRKKPFHTILRTWRNMAVVFLPLGWWFCADAGRHAWHAWLVIPAPCLGGPISWLFLEPDELLVVVGQVGFYGLGVAWFVWKPCGWSKAVFILLSVLWMLVGCAIVCLPV